MEVLRAGESWGGGINPLVEALLDSARRGVRVRLLLDDSFQDRENAELAFHLGARAREESIPLEVRQGRPQGISALHNKGWVVDGEVVGVGSTNWVRSSWEKNREVLLLLWDPTLAAEAQRRFERDWESVGVESGGAEGPPRFSPLPEVWVIVGVLGMAGSWRGSLPVVRVYAPPAPSPPDPGRGLKGKGPSLAPLRR